MNWGRFEVRLSQSGASGRGGEREETRGGRRKRDRESERGGEERGAQKTPCCRILSKLKLYRAIDGTLT